MATVYAIASAKGGVGKTTTTAAIATILADAGADVVAIDADIGMANLAGVVGLTPDGATLHDVLAGTTDPHDAVYDGPAGLRIVPGATALDAYATADPTGLRDVVAAFDDADYVLIDAGAGLSHDSTLPLGIADETLLVSTAERNALNDTEKTRQLTTRLGGVIAGAVITRTTDSDDDTAALVAERLDADVLGRIPEDDAVRHAADAGEPLSQFAPAAPATAAYRTLAAALTGDAVDTEPVDGSGGAGGPGSDADDPDGEAGGPDDDADGADSDNGETATTPPDSETEHVGDEHVAGDDLEAMIETGFDDEAGFDNETEFDDDADEREEAESAPEEAGADRTDPHDTAADQRDTDAAIDQAEPDIEDELAGSIPFRDDDNTTADVPDADTPTAESTEAHGDDSVAIDDTADGTNDTRDGTNDTANESDDTADESDDTTDSEAEAVEESADNGGGFFSRLFGR